MQSGIEETCLKGWLGWRDDSSCALTDFSYADGKSNWVFKWKNILCIYTQKIAKLCLEDTGFFPWTEAYDKLTER